PFGCKRQNGFSFLRGSRSDATLHKRLLRPYWRGSGCDCRGAWEDECAAMQENSRAFLVTSHVFRNRTRKCRRARSACSRMAWNHAWSVRTSVVDSVVRQQWRMPGKHPSPDVLSWTRNHGNRGRLDASWRRRAENPMARSNVAVRPYWRTDE